MCTSPGLDSSQQLAGGGPCGELVFDISQQWKSKRNHLQRHTQIESLHKARQAGRTKSTYSRKQRNKNKMITLIKPMPTYQR